MVGLPVVVFFYCLWHGYGSPGMSRMLRWSPYRIRGLGATRNTYVVHLWIGCHSFWMTRQNPEGGWAAWTGLGKNVHDSTIAIGCAALLYRTKRRHETSF